MARLAKQHVTFRFTRIFKYAGDRYFYRGGMMRDDDLRDYHAELKQEYADLERDLAYHDKIYKRDFINYDKTKVDNQLRNKAQRIAQQIGTALMRGDFDAVYDLKMNLLRLLVQMNPDTRKAFKQSIYLDRLSPAGERAYSKIVPLVEVAALPQPDRIAYITLVEISNQCDRYEDDPAAFKPMRVSLTRKYSKTKPQVMAIYTKTSSPVLQHDIEFRMDIVEQTLGTGKSVQRRQQKTPVPARKKTAAARARTTAKQPSILDRAITFTGFRL